MSGAALSTMTAFSDSEIQKLAMKEYTQPQRLLSEWEMSVNVSLHQQEQFPVHSRWLS